MTDRNIPDLLAEVAEAAERERDTTVPGRRSRAVAADPAQVYSVRIPVSRIEELRRLAAERGRAPSGLMREWILDRLDRESGRAPAVWTATRVRLVQRSRTRPARGALPVEPAMAGSLAL